MIRRGASWFWAVALVLGAVAGYGVWRTDRQVVRLSEGGWIRMPKAVVATLGAKLTTGMWTWTIKGGVATPYVAIVSEPPSLSRRIFEMLPPAAQKVIPSVPAPPRSREHLGATEHVLVFRCDSAIDERVSGRLGFAIADADGNISDLPNISRPRPGAWIVTDACFPRSCREVSLLVYEVQSYPLATVRIRNPLYNVPATRKWPDGKVEAEAKWNDVTFKLTRATRYLTPKHDRSGEIEFAVEGGREFEDFRVVATLVEDSSGNAWKGQFSGKSGGVQIRMGRVFWPENPNIKVTLFVRGASSSAMALNQFHRIRIPLAPGWTEATALSSDVPFVLDGQTIQTVRLTKPVEPKFSVERLSKFNLDPSLYEEVFVSCETGMPKASGVELVEFDDGRANADSYAWSRGEVGYSLMIRKDASYLECTAISSAEQKLEFYGQLTFVP